jgi:hypothetical protein
MFIIFFHTECDMPSYSGALVTIIMEICEHSLGLMLFYIAQKAPFIESDIL